MKNLRVFRSQETELWAEIVGQCFDADNGIMFALDSKFKLIIMSTNHVCDHNLDLKKVNDFDKKSLGIIMIIEELGKLEKDDIKLIEFVVECGSIFVALKSGKLVRIGVSSFSPPSKCLYEHHNKISSIKLSPDQDLIALADEYNNLYILSIDCDILHQSNAFDQNDSLHKPVGVGWGSKETQFFGLDGRPSKEKQLKDQVVLSEEELKTLETIESSKEFVKTRECLRKSTSLDWRGDGQYIATLTYLPEVDKHYLKIWNRNLDLQYMSEQLVTIERGLLSWIPNGQYVCCAQCRDQKINDIALFEKNGMVHQRITLPTIMSNSYIKEMAWSSDSKILAIILNEFHLEQNGDKIYNKPILMLYTMQNFHYYLKYTTSLHDNGDYSLKWDTINQKRLYVISSTGHFNAFECSFEVTFSQQNTTVTVIDGNKIQLTPMSFCNIPPPMSAIELEVDNIIHNVVINPSKASNMFIITLDDRLIVTSSSISTNNANDTNQIIKLELKSRLEKIKVLHNEIKSFKIFPFKNAQSYQNLTIIGEHLLVVNLSTPLGSEITKICLPESPDSNELKFETLTVVKNKKVVFISRNDLGDVVDKLVLLFSDKSSMILDLINNELTEYQTAILTDSKMVYTYLDAKSVLAKAKVEVVSLGQDLTLRFGAKIIASNRCTSFRLTENFLLYTTTDNTLHFIFLTNLYNAKQIDDSIESWTQPIEAGGTLVIVSESESKVVLQMPRGNLETLHPRILILALCTSLLDEKKYVDAIKLARYHRLNMNFLADYLLRLTDLVEEYYEPTEEIFEPFAKNVVLTDPSLLTLFVTELDDVDTMTSRYANVLNHLPKREVNFNDKLPMSFKDKTNLICSHFIKSLINLGTSEQDINLSKARLICLLKKKPREIVKALNYVHELVAKKDIQEELLKFILYFVDIDQLFNEALGTYSTKITLMVAGISHKDPKEYLSLLNDFDKIEEPLMRNYTIDMHIKRYKFALENLLQLVIRDQTNKDIDLKLTSMLYHLVVEHRLYKHTLSLLYRSDIVSDSNLNTIRRSIWVEYAHYLLEKKHYSESGIAYSKALELGFCQDYINAAIKCYLLADNWEQPLALIQRFGREEEEEELKKANLLKVHNYLINDDKHFKMAPLISNICDSSVSRKLIQKDCWHFDEFIATSQSKNEEISKGERVLSSFEHFTFELKEGYSGAKERFNRLKDLILTYQTRKLEYNYKQNSNFISDTLSTVDGSEATSVVSGSDFAKESASGSNSIKTRKSNRSSRSQAFKQKRINLKPGSRHEDLALILEIQTYLNEQRENQKQGMKLGLALFDYCDFDCADKSVKEMNVLLEEGFNFCKEILDTLWPTSQDSEQKYSLYRRFSDLLSSDGPFENLDFQVLIRPNLPSIFNYFEL